MLQTGYTQSEIVSFLTSIYPLDQEKLNAMLPKQGMQLTIKNDTQRLRIIKTSGLTYAVYFELYGVQL